jgi:hypothetical protein
MKDKDYNMLTEAYNQVNENLYGKPQAKFIDMEDGRQMRDLEEMDKQALFAYVMNKPQLRKELDYLVGTGSMPQISKWIESLEKSQNVISNGLQKSYLFNVCREEIFAKNPRAKEEYEALNKKLDGPLSRHPSANKSNISSLSKQDPREVEGYGKTYQEARNWDYEPWAGEQGDIEKEWHGLSAKTPEPPSVGDLIKYGKEMQDVELGGGMKKSMPVHSLANSIIDALDEHGDVNYNDLAKAVAIIFKREYESQMLPADKFIEAFKNEINTRKS